MSSTATTPNAHTRSANMKLIKRNIPDNRRSNVVKKKKQTRRERADRPDDGCSEERKSWTIWTKTKKTTKTTSTSNSSFPHFWLQRKLEPHATYSLLLTAHAYGFWFFFSFHLMHASLSSSLGHSNRLFSHSNRTKNRDKKSLNFIFRFNWIIRNSCVLHASGLSQSADTLGHQWNQINKCIAFFCSYPSNEWCAIGSTMQCWMCADGRQRFGKQNAI